MTVEDRREHEEKLAKIAARNQAFQRSPITFTIWDWGSKIIGCAGWAIVIFCMAQCACDGCVLK